MISTTLLNLPGDWHKFSIGPLFDKEADCFSVAGEVSNLVVAANVPGYPISGVYFCWHVSPAKTALAGIHSRTTANCLAT
jgi:hypothetical protein